MSIHAGDITPFVSTGPRLPVAGVNTIAGAAVTHAATEEATFTRVKPRRVRVRARKPGKGEQTAWVNDDSSGKGVGQDGKEESLLVPVAVGGSDMADAIDPSLETADPQGGEDEAKASLDPLPAPGAEAAHADEG